MPFHRLDLRLICYRPVRISTLLSVNMTPSEWDKWAMKHFLLEGERLVPFEERAPELIAAHRQFLQRGYDQGRFLLSGPSVPPKGGVLIARAESIDELNDYLADEPYCKAKVMRFAKVTEFDPVQHQPILSDWFGK